MKVIIIGSSSGIGMHLAHIMSDNSIALGLTGRRMELLKDLKAQLSTQVVIKYVDIRDTDKAIEALNSLIQEMDGADMIFISAGTGYINKDLDWSLEKETIETNVLGVTAMIDASMKYFMAKKSGHLAVITSIAGLRGSGVCPAYNASKAYLSNYLEGIRCNIKKKHCDITITDIRPGLVDTAMAKGDSLFWVMQPEIVADQIYKALTKRKDLIYVTKRWYLFAWFLKIVPKFIYYRI
jgi:Short-chain dehydrogenases of various substrate specificities